MTFAKKSEEGLHNPKIILIFVSAKRKKNMAHIEIRIDKERLKRYGETKYYVYFGYHQLFEFVNRFKGIWYFYNAFSEQPFCTINSDNVPIDRIKNLAVAHATIVNGGEELADKELYGDKVSINRKAKDYPNL